MFVTLLGQTKYQLEYTISWEDLFKRWAQFCLLICTVCLVCSWFQQVTEVKSQGGGVTFCKQKQKTWYNLVVGIKLRALFHLWVLPSRWELDQLDLKWNDFQTVLLLFVLGCVVLCHRCSPKTAIMLFFIKGKNPVFLLDLFNKPLFCSVCSLFGTLSNLTDSCHDILGDGAQRRGLVWHGVVSRPSELDLITLWANY